MEERDLLFMYSLFWRHRDFPDVALIASALRLRGGKKSITSPSEKQVMVGVRINFIQALILHWLTPLLPFISFLHPRWSWSSSANAAAAITQYNTMAQGLILALLGPLDKRLSADCCRRMLLQPGELHGSHWPQLVLKVWGCCYENAGPWVNTQSLPPELGTRGSATSRQEGHRDINKYSLTASDGNSRLQGVIHRKAASFSNLATAAVTYKLLLDPNSNIWEEGSGLFMPNQFRSLFSKIPKQELKIKHVFMCFAKWGWNIPPHVQALLNQDLICSPNYGARCTVSSAWRQPGPPLVLMCWRSSGD